MYLPVGHGASEQAIIEFAHSVQRGFQTTGMTVRAPPAILKGNPQGDVAIMVAELFSKANAQCGAKPELLMFLLHGASERLYSAIKNACDIQFGIASQGCYRDLLQSRCHS